MEDQTAIRKKLRAEMIVESGGKCHSCGAKNNGLHDHELVNRGRIKKGSPARLISYRKTLCVLLCPTCHERAHNPAERERLFKLNFKRYGYTAVKLDFDALIEALGGVSIGVNLPGE